MSADEIPPPAAAEKGSTETTVETVDSLDSDGHISRSEARGAVLVPPAQRTVETVDSGVETVDSTVDSADSTVDLGSMDAYAPDGPWAYAERVQGRIFMITTDWVHPDSGDVLITPETVAEVVARKGNLRTAWVDHNKDVYSEEDAGKNPRAVVGEPVPAHAHVMEERRNATRLGAVARAYRVPPNFVKVMKGHGAFLDGCEYLTHEAANQSHKYRYPDAEVHANFDFRAEVDEHVAARGKGRGGSGGGMTERVRELRRRVGTGEMTLDEARELDFDAWAEDLPRLEKLRAAYEEREGRTAAGQVGGIWRKSLVVITGQTRNGKDVLAEELGQRLVGLAALAGLTWQYIKPPGKNSLEDIGRAEVIHHEDMRFRLLPDYDEALRYFDPNQAAAASGRHKNRGVPTPRAIMATSSESLLSLGYTLKRRKDKDELVMMSAAADKRPHPLNIDEFLFRVGWHAEVVKPSGDPSYDEIRDGMMVSIYRVREGEAARVVEVVDGDGFRVGDVRTRHRLEPVAVIRGVEHAANFLAVSILTERNPDVVSAIPAEAFAPYAGHHAAIEAAAVEAAAAEAAEAAAATAAIAALVREHATNSWDTLLRAADARGLDRDAVYDAAVAAGWTDSGRAWVLSLPRAIAIPETA